MRGSRKFHQGKGEESNKVFFNHQHFHRGRYGPPSKSNWTLIRVRTSISKNYIAACDLPGLQILCRNAESANATKAVAVYNKW